MCADGPKTQKNDFHIFVLSDLDLVGGA